MFHLKRLLRRIEIWTLDPSGILDISRCELTKFPSILIPFTDDIIRMNCSENHLLHLPPLYNCIKLDCSNNKIDKLSSLFSCVSLDCSNNQLVNLPYGLTECKFIDCSNNQIKGKLYTHSNILHSCEVLWCNGNKIDSHGLPDLPNCRWLKCKGNNEFIKKDFEHIPKCVDKVVCE